MSRDLIFYQFSRSKVEQSDFSHFLSLYARDKLPEGQALQEMMNCFVLCVDGWDNDPREIHTIPEIRRFYSSFHNAWPYWLYFCNLDVDTLRAMTMCCLPSITAMQVDGLTQAAVTCDPLDLIQFIKRDFMPMNLMCERAKMSERSIYDGTKRCSSISTCRSTPSRLRRPCGARPELDAMTRVPAAAARNTRSAAAWAECECNRMNAIRTYNVEAGLPTLDDARRLVIAEIKQAKRDGVKVLKVIHGYGSSGKGGKLNFGLRKSFALRKKEGVIKDFIAGEDFTIFNPTVLALLETVPELRGDPDLGATNEGVTVLWLK